VSIPEEKREGAEDTREGASATTEGDAPATHEPAEPTEPPAPDAAATEEAPEASVAFAKDPAPPPDVAPKGEGDPLPDVLFEALWKRVLEAWDDDKPHVAILEHAMRSEMLPELAGRYRAEKDVPGHEVRAKKKLDAIVIAATQMLMATKTEKAPKAPWQLTASVAVVCVLVLVYVAFKVFRP